MFANTRPLKKFGIKPEDAQKNFIYSTVKYGETFELLKEMKKLNRKIRKLRLEDRKYFVFPVGGMLNNSILVYGKTANFYPPIVHR